MNRKPFHLPGERIRRFVQAPGVEVDTARLAGLASAVLAAVLGLEFARLTWRAVPEPPATGVEAPRPAVQAAQRVARQPLRELTDLAPFGRAPEATGVPAGAGRSDGAARRSALPLTLRGVVAMEGGGIAIIARQGAEERAFRVGAEVFGVARLTAVHPGHVVLDREGQSEELHFPKEASSGNQEKVSARSGGDAAGAAQTPAQALSELRSAIVAGGFARYQQMLGYAPERDASGVVGYRLQARNEEGRGLLQKLGAADGDVIRALDGVPLDGGASTLAAFKRLKTATEVEITFVRDGVEETRTLRFDPP